MNMVSVCFQLLVLAAAGETAEWFGGEAPLGPQDARRHLFRPYSAVELNCLGANYCENMLDLRLNITSFTHQECDTNHLDAFHLQFPDDSARLVEALVWEDAYSGIVRLETVRRLMLGLMNAHIPGTQGYHFFRHRSGGKTYLIFDHPAGDGRVLLSTWGDDIQGAVTVGFRAQYGEDWVEPKDFESTTTPENGGTPGVARSPEFWNESPYVLAREFTRHEQSVKFTGRYWLSDEDMPIEYGYEASGADRIAINIGEPGKHIPLLWDAESPGIIEFGDRKTRWESNTDGDQVLTAPECQYLVLWKEATWACPGYGSALLVMWEGQAEAVEVLAEQGYGQIRVVFSQKEGAAKGRVWLYPFHWINPNDREYIFRNAESFLNEGKLMHKGFPSQQMVNAIPSGLAAGAYLLTKYNAPLARTAQIEAENAADVYLNPEREGKRFLRLFFEVKTAAWMMRLGKLLNDQAMVEKYEAWVKLTMDRLLSEKAGYDGTAWGDGWTHFCTMRAVWLAFEATGNPAYREAYERAMTVYTIDEKGVYRYGKPLEAPGGFEVYAGALPMAVWGHWGLKDQVEQLINLRVPNGWHNPEIPVADLWNDAGAGPWSQDDAQPDMVGFMLRGYDLPTEPKRILPTGAFSMLDEQGGFTANFAPIVDNPFFLPGPREIRELKKGETLPVPEIKTVDLDLSGQEATPPCITQRIDLTDAKGAALDIHMNRGSYQVEVSPDGERWFTRLDTWCDSPTIRSVDLSFLLGSSEELVKILDCAPPEDTPFLHGSEAGEILRTHCRSVSPEGELVYRIELPKIDRCHIEFLIGNNYRIDLSSDGVTWEEALSPGQIPPREGLSQKNAAWLRMVDAMRFAEAGDAVYVRLRNAGNTAAYGEMPAFLRRMTVYGTFKSSEVFLRVNEGPFTRDKGIVTERLSVRSW
jgi:hypothetical protein